MYSTVYYPELATRNNIRRGGLGSLDLDVNQPLPFGLQWSEALLIGVGAYLTYRLASGTRTRVDEYKRKRDQRKSEAEHKRTRLRKAREELAAAGGGTFLGGLFG